MTTCAKLTSLENAVRDLMARDSFVESRALMGEYVVEAERLLCSEQTGREEARDLMNRVETVFQFISAMVQMSRAQLAEELSNVRCVRRYRQATCALARFRTKA